MSAETTGEGDTATLHDPGRVASDALPILRTWASGKFRLFVAVMLVAAGVILSGVYAAVLFETQPDSWAYDVSVYYHAAQRIRSTGSPYLAMQLAGPTDALCPDCYLYPPPLAQAFAPSLALSLGVTRFLWLVVQCVAMFVAVWLSTGLRGARRSLERATWCLVATILYVPVFLSLWFGNVSTLIALCATPVAMGGLAAGAGAAVSSLLKTVPATLIPAALFMGRSARLSMLASTAVIVGVSIAAAPSAWLEYPQVLANMILRSADYPLNLAPAAVMTQWGVGAWVTGLVRLATVAIAIACVIGSVWSARRLDGAPFAALLAMVTMLLIPGSLWYHYLAVLLPFAAMAWPDSGAGVRIALIASAVLVSVGAGTPVLALGGAVLLVAVAGRTLRPGFKARSSVSG